MASWIWFESPLKSCHEHYLPWIKALTTTWVALHYTYLSFVNAWNPLLSGSDRLIAFPKTSNCSSVIMNRCRPVNRLVLAPNPLWVLGQKGSLLYKGEIMSIRPNSYGAIYMPVNAPSTLHRSASDWLHQWVIRFFLFWERNLWHHSLDPPG